MSQSFISTGTNSRFHFLFELEATSEDPFEPYKASGIDNNNTDFEFRTPITSLETLTLSFGNPFQTLAFYPDRLPAVISADGAQTLLTFTEPHFNQVGDTVSIEDFTTDRPVDDYVEINLMNAASGWVVSAATATTLHIDVDISGLLGTIQGSPHQIYFESKRFVIPLEIRYLE